MKLRTSMLALIGVIVAFPVFAAEQTVTLSVPGMYCASCPYIVESAMGDVEGVISVTADPETRTALVVFDDAITSVGDIEFASTSVGYKAEFVSEDSNS